MFTQEQVLSRQGAGIREIARQLGCSRNTVPRHLQEGEVPWYGPRAPRPTKLDAFKPYVVTRIEAARPKWIPAMVLLREIRERGYEGGLTQLKLFVAPMKDMKAPDPVVRVEELLKATIDTAVATKAVRPNEFERVIVDSTVQEKAIAFPTDSRVLEIARHKVVMAAKAAGIALKQTFAREGKSLRRRAGGYADARQYKRLRRVLKRQRTVLGIILREIARKLETTTTESGFTVHRLHTVMERAERIRKQQPKDKNKRYTMHAPEVEYIGKGKACQPYGSA